MSTIKMIALDLGGTLLSDDNTISKENIQAIESAKKSGTKIVLSTARMYSSTKYISNVINADYGVFSNGAFIMDIKRLKTLKSNLLDYKTAVNLIHFARKKGLYIHINQALDEVAEEVAFFTQKHLFLNKQYPDNLKSNILVVPDIIEYIKKSPELLKTVLVSSSNMKEVIPEVEKILQDNNGFITEFYEEMYESAIDKTISYIEIGSDRDNKAKGLLELCNLTNINSKEVLVIGDGRNDVEMMMQFPHSVCMANGNDYVKSIASYTTTNTNNQSGVAEAIKRFVLKN